VAVVVVADSGSAEVRVVESIGAEVVVGVVVLVVLFAADTASATVF